MGFQPMPYGLGVLRIGISNYNGDGFVHVCPRIPKRMMICRMETS